MNAREAFLDAAKSEILIKDGPYGTAIQDAGLSANDLRLSQIDEVVIAFLVVRQAGIARIVLRR